MQIVESSSVLIRLAHPQDRQEIIELEKLAIQNLCQDKYDAQKFDILTRNMRPISFDDEIMFVAEENNLIVGFASLLSYRKILRTLYVKPKFLKQQIGVKLLKAIEKEAAKHQIKTLKVTPSLSERGFYTGLGYEEIAICLLDKMDILVPCIAMEKKLTPMGYRTLLFKVLSQIVLATVPNLFFLLLLI